MDIFLDCEFNETRGVLISIALVPLDPGLLDFYVYRNDTDRLSLKPWVIDNVLPILDAEVMAFRESRIAFKDFPQELSKYLWHMHSIATARGQRLNIVADWPSDPIYLFDLILDPYVGSLKISTPPFSVELREDMDKSESPLHPHNALSDARAMAQSARVALSR